MKTICKLKQCARPHYALGLCRRHYKHFRKAHGISNHPSKQSQQRLDTPEKLKARFDEKWERQANGCWQWIGSHQNPKGTDNPYKLGEMIVMGRKRRAHRLSWEVHCGSIGAGLFVLHKCDNSLCVNPEHLYLGTHEDNMRDMSIRQRAHWRKITNTQAKEIRASRETTAELARVFRVSESAIRSIRQMKSKRHI